MTRSAARCAALAILAAALLTGLRAVPSAAAAAAPRAQLADFTCTPALQPAGRRMAVQTVMRPLPGTSALAVRFSLVARVGGRRAEMVRAGDLGSWTAPNDPTIGRLPADVWRLDKSVLNLAAPADYRFQVVFRWTDAGGRVLATAVRLSPDCHQPELRPDLLVRSVTADPDPGRPGEDVYHAVVADAGATGAGPFQVLLAPGDSAPAVVDTIGSLGPHRAVTVSLSAPACDPAAPPTLTVDPAHQVGDFNRANNGVTVACPPAG